MYANLNSYKLLFINLNNDVLSFNIIIIISERSLSTNMLLDVVQNQFTPFIVQRKNKRAYWI